MCEQSDRTTPATADSSGQDQGPAMGPSRRSFVKSSAALATGIAAAQVLSRDAFAQAAGAVDAELARVQGERRILLKGGVVLTHDREGRPMNGWLMWGVILPVLLVVAGIITIRRRNHRP